MLGPRLLTAAVGIPLLLVVLWAGETWLAVLIGVLVLLASIETSELLDGAGYAPALGLIVFFGVAAVALAGVAVEWLGAGWIGWLIALVAATLAVALLQPAPTEVIRSWIGSLFGSIYVALLSFLLLIAVTTRPESATGLLVEWLDPGRAWLLVVVSTVWACDSAAYVVGRMWPWGSFFNHISPAKTWSGAAGGGVAAVAAGLLLGLLVGRPLEGAGLGLLVTFAAPMGDLAESALKRAAGVKDSGRLFPGHGGVLDRVDAFVIVAPMAWLYLVVVGVA
ncbi:phosphatidate cytidylyltransferase [soil metagenome]